MEDEVKKTRRKILRKITPYRLKNIALFYLKRFDSSTDNLRRVLKKRVYEYGREYPEFDRGEAELWIEDILEKFQDFGYLNDKRYATQKIQGYLSAGKPKRYILGKMKEHGIDEELSKKILEEQDYDPYEMAIKLAKKRKIGPFRPENERSRESRQKDMGILARAGFEYDIICDVMALNSDFDSQDFY